MLIAFTVIFFFLFSICVWLSVYVEDLKIESDKLTKPILYDLKSKCELDTYTAQKYIDEVIIPYEKNIEKLNNLSIKIKKLDEINTETIIYFLFSGCVSFIILGENFLNRYSVAYKIILLIVWVSLFIFVIFLSNKIYEKSKYKFEKYENVENRFKPFNYHYCYEESGFKNYIDEKQYYKIIDNSNFFRYIDNYEYEISKRISIGAFLQKTYRICFFINPFLIISFCLTIFSN